MKISASLSLRSTAARLAGKMKPKPRLQLAPFLAAVILQVSVPEIGATPDKPVTPNRTLPKVTPARSGPTFSANPTTHEICRARVFEEPLAPIGGEPTVAENAALAAVLLAYVGRSGPDDFASLTGFWKDILALPGRRLS